MKYITFYCKSLEAVLAHNSDTINWQDMGTSVSTIRSNRFLSEYIEEQDLIYYVLPIDNEAQAILFQAVLANMDIDSSIITDVEAIAIIDSFSI